MLEENSMSPIVLFLKALTVDPPITTWRYDPNGTLVETNSTRHILHMIFAHAGGLQQALEHGREHGAPLMFSAELGLVWCAIFGRDKDELQQMFVLGPVFFSDASDVEIEEKIRGKEMDYSTRRIIIETVREVSVVPSMTFFHLCLMLHYCVTGEKLSRADIVQQEAPRNITRGTHSRRDRLRTWQAERVLLQMVKDGDINYRSAMERAGRLSSGVPVKSSDQLLPAIVSCATFTGLCTRAAIDGGLIPDEAYTLGDSYVQQLLSCKTLSELRSVNHAMYEDFILHVHRLHQNPNVSGVIQGVIDYVEIHLEDELRTEGIAAHFGYTRAYLSHRFKEETGEKLSDFIRYARIERAKKMLSGTDMSVREIAQALRFASSTHFSDHFREITGMLPLAYRKASAPDRSESMPIQAK